MAIGLSDELTPLGSFPILQDIYLKGGYQTVADTTARDAIAVAGRKVGMLVYTVASTQLWILGPGITNGDWSLYTTPVGAHASTHLPGGTDALTTAAPTQGIGATNGAGSASTFARSDHDHKLRTTTGPTDLTIDAVADGEFLKRVGTAIVSAAFPSIAITVQDEGTPQSTTVNTLNFTGQGVTASGGGATATVNVPGGGNVVARTTVNSAASPYTVLTTDHVIYVDTTSGPVTLNLPAHGTTDRIYDIIDVAGNLAANNCTLARNGGTGTIGGVTADYVMSAAWQVVRIASNTTNAWWFHS